MINDPNQSTPCQPDGYENKKQKRTIKRSVNYLAAVIANIILLFVVNNLEGWQLAFIKTGWLEIVGFLNFSIILGLAVNLVFLIYDEYRFYFLGRTTLDLVSVYVIWKVFSVFPFDFGVWNTDWLNTAAQICLIFALLATLIGIIVRTARMILNKNIYY